MTCSINKYADAVRQLIASAPIPFELVDCRDSLLNSVTETPPSILALPVVSCLASGGLLANGAKVAASWMALNHASYLLDKVEDRNVASDNEMIAVAKTLNLSTASIFIAYHLLSDLPSSEQCARVVKVFSECGFQATQGQHMSFDPWPGMLDEAIKVYWQATILKSGSLFRMACAGGAAAGTDSPELIEALGYYGTSLGVILQVLDDCRDMLDKKSGEYEVSLPVLLYSASLGENRIVIPRSRKDLKEKLVPETITEALAVWWQRAQDNLKKLEPSDAREILLDILQSIVGESVWGEAQ